MSSRSRSFWNASAGALIALCQAMVIGVPESAAAAGAVSDRPIGEPLSQAGAKYGLSDADMAQIRAAGGEFSCPGDGTDGARLNAWLIGDRQVLTNAHAIVE